MTTPTFIYRRYNFIYDEGFEVEIGAWKLLKNGKWVVRPDAPEDSLEMCKQLEACGLTITSWEERVENPLLEGTGITQYIVAVSAKA
jgi:hypothetical protein